MFLYHFSVLKVTEMNTIFVGLFTYFQSELHTTQELKIL